MNPAKNPKITTQEERKVREGTITSKSLLVKPLMETLWPSGSLLIWLLQTGMVIETSRCCLLLARMRALLCLLGGLTGLPLPGSEEVVPDQIALLCPVLVVLAKGSQQQLYKLWGAMGRQQKLSHTPWVIPVLSFSSSFQINTFFACASLYLKPTFTSAVWFVWLSSVCVRVIHTNNLWTCWPKVLTDVRAVKFYHFTKTN